MDINAYFYTSTEAAKELGISKATFWRNKEKYLLSTEQIGDLVLYPKWEVELLKRRWSQESKNLLPGKTCRRHKDREARLNQLLDILKNQELNAETLGYLLGVNSTSIKRMIKTLRERGNTILSIRKGGWHYSLVISYVVLGGSPTQFKQK